jgi:hypothetical protein
MHELDAGNRRSGFAELLETKHRTKPKFDRSVILLDQIIQVFRGAYKRPLSLLMFAEDFPNCPM